jgi:hypothetical protein
MEIAVWRAFAPYQIVKSGNTVSSEAALRAAGKLRLPGAQRINPRLRFDQFPATLYIPGLGNNSESFP